MHPSNNFLLLLCFITSFSANCQDENKLVFRTEENVHSGADYLVKSLLENGQFVYRVNANPEVRVKSSYNILRHAGSIYALCQYQQEFPDRDVKNTIIHSGAYLRDSAMAPLRRKRELNAIWSYPAVNKKGDPKQAKLGGSGIGLLVLCHIEEITPGFTPLEDLKRVGEFILYMQKENGSFYSKYIPSDGGRNDRWNSLYYPGEACLGLLMLYELDPDPRWIQGAANGLSYLADKREGQTDIPADHWALLATARLLELKNSEQLFINLSKLLRHAIQISESMLWEQNLDHPEEVYFGGFTEDGRTTPTATRLEGLLAVYNILPANHPLRKRILSAAELGINFLSKAQLAEGEYKGGMPRAISTLNNQEVNSPFNRRAKEIRIDYVQHAISACLQYIKIMQNVTRPSSE